MRWEVRREGFIMWLAARLPHTIRKWVIVNAAIKAREPEMRPGGGYCGPDGLTYKDLYENA